MIDRTPENPPLEAVLARIKRREASPWGKAQRHGHEWLARLENSPFLIRFSRIFRPPAALPSLRPEPAIDLDSLFVVSFVLHMAIFVLLAQLTLRSVPEPSPAPVVVRLLDFTAPEKTRARPPAATDRPQRQVTLPPERRAPAEPAPPLPAPKALVPAAVRTEAAARQRAETLVQLPTRSEMPAESRSAPTATDPLPGSLRRPNELFATGSGPAERAGHRAEQPSDKTAALSNPDFSRYLAMLKKRVEDRWNYPGGISGKHEVNILFVLDRGGKLTRVEVLDSTDSRLHGSAVRAMKQASPFPPIPDSLKDLAGWPLRMRFQIDFGLRVTE